MAKINVSLLDKFEKLIKSGKAYEVHGQLQNIKFQDVHENNLQRVANIMIRAGLARNAISLLKPMVHPAHKILRSPTQGELAEYALALAQIGVSAEALEMFNKLDYEQVPQAAIYRAICHFGQWDYAKAIPYLENVVDKKLLPEYQLLVAKVNLASAFLVDHKYEQSLALLNEALLESKQKNNRLLYGNCLELKAQYHFGQNNYHEANDVLLKAQSELVDAPAKDKLTVKKWIVLCQVGLRSHDKRFVSEQIYKLRMDSLKIDHWQTARECDFYESLFTRNDELFTKVVFGTPFQAYRDKLIKVYDPKFTLPATYRWNPAMAAYAATDILDVGNGVDLKSGAEIGRGGILHKLLKTMTSDFYVNFNTDALFSLLYPEEFYSPESSPSRVYSNLDRLGKWFRENKVPISVNKHVAGYRVFAEVPYGLEVKNSLSLDTEGSILELIKTHLLVEDGFSTSEVVEKLKMTKSTVIRRLNELSETGLIESKGGGRSRKYFLKKAG